MNLRAPPTQQHNRCVVTKNLNIDIYGLSFASLLDSVFRRHHFKIGIISVYQRLLSPILVCKTFYQNTPFDLSILNMVDFICQHTLLVQYWPPFVSFGFPFRGHP